MGSKMYFRPSFYGLYILLNDKTTNSEEVFFQGVNRSIANTLDFWKFNLNL